MDSCLSLTCWLKRLAGFGLAGAGFVLFAGPILTAVLTIAVMALVGFLMWLPLHTAFVGPCSTWRNACEGGKRWRRRVGHWWWAVDRGCGSVASTVGNTIVTWWPVVVGTLREGISGAILGGLVILLAGIQGPAVALAALIGGMAGIVVGFHWPGKTA
jgi:hypothetical protein